MESLYLVCPAEKKLVKPTGGMKTVKPKDAGKSQVASKEQNLIKKNKPAGMNWI